MGERGETHGGRERETEVVLMKTIRNPDEGHAYHDCHDNDADSVRGVDRDGEGERGQADGHQQRKIQTLRIREESEGG